MKVIIFMLLSSAILSCKAKQQSSGFAEIEIVEDANRNIIMAKSGIADSNNFRTFKYYDTTGRLVFVIESGGTERLRRMFSPQIIDTGAGTILAGKYFYKEYLLSVFGQPNNFRTYFDVKKINNKNTVFNITDSIIFNNYNFHLSQAEFENLLNFLK